MGFQRPAGRPVVQWWETSPPMQTVIVLGPDRVGKTTLIEASQALAESAGYSVSALHFREVQPHHHSPIGQFYEALGPGMPRTDFCFVDRFVYDTAFYESQRQNFPPIPDSYLRSVESLIVGKSGSDVSVLHLNMGWSGTIADRHRREIMSRWPAASEYWVGINLEKRRQEHIGYNEFVRSYFKRGGSILGKERYTAVDRVPAGATIFSLCDLPVPDSLNRTPVKAM